MERCALRGGVDLGADGEVCDHWAGPHAKHLEGEEGERGHRVVHHGGDGQEGKAHGLAEHPNAQGALAADLLDEEGDEEAGERERLHDDHVGGELRGGARREANA